MGVVAPCIRHAFSLAFPTWAGCFGLVCAQTLDASHMHPDRLMHSVDFLLYRPAPHAEEHPSIAVCTPAAFNMNAFRATVGPGWFESSRDLERGLTVLEGAPAELAFNDWLENSLHGQ